MKVRNLLIKRARGTPLAQVSSFCFTPDGIVGGVLCQPLRQVLLLPQSTLSEFGLMPGDIRENIVVDEPRLHDLQSGTILYVGEARIRLTFHCEPCDRVSPYAKPKQLLHKRGYLGRFLDSGRLSIGDDLVISNEKDESIPYGIKDRVSWFLEQRDSPISARALLWEVGLSTSYARALPRLLQGVSPTFRELVVFGSDNARKQSILFASET